MLGASVMEVVAVMAYYLADVVVRGSDASIVVSRTALVWVVLGIGAGAIFGAAGAAVDDPSSVLRAVGIALLPAVFLAEASHQMIRHLTTDADSRPDDLMSTALLLTALAAASADLAASRPCFRREGPHARRYARSSGGRQRRLCGARRLSRSSAPAARAEPILQV